MATDPVCGMAVNEKTGLNLDRGGKRYYFCSARCKEKFIKEQRIPEDGSVQCAAAERNRPFYTGKVFLVCAVLAALMILSFAVPVLIPFRDSFLNYLKMIWWAVLAGMLLGGIIDHYIPREYISLLLAEQKKRTIVRAVFLGFLMSACSHGILALTIQLHKKGASNPSVVAFLLASPWANMAITVLLFGLFGIKALFIIAAAVLIAVNTGLIFQILEKRGFIEKNAKTLPVSKDFSIMQDMRKRIQAYTFTIGALAQDAKGIINGALSLSDMVLWWILIGMGIASFAGAYIPAHVFHQFMGQTIIGLLVTLGVATVIEVCSEGSAPMAFEIFKQTGALGNSFVFLMAGVVTDYTEIGLLWHNVGRKTALWLPVVTVPQVILLGFIANKLL